MPLMSEAGDAPALGVHAFGEVPATERAGVPAVSGGGIRVVWAAAVVCDSAVSDVAVRDPAISPRAMTLARICLRIRDPHNKVPVETTGAQPGGVVDANVHADWQHLRAEIQRGLPGLKIETWGTRLLSDNLCPEPLQHIVIYARWM